MEWQRAIIKGDNSECRRALLGGRLPQQRCWGSGWSLQQEGRGREATRHRSALSLLKESGLVDLDLVGQNNWPTQRGLFYLPARLPSPHPFAHYLLSCSKLSLPSER